MLIILSGLPGTGKTTLARELARHLEAVHIRIDSIEQAIMDSSLSIESVEDAGYRAGYAAAEDNMRLGKTVIADSVNPVEAPRAAWREVAKRVDGTSVEIEIVCSDLEQHRRRIETRVSDVRGLNPPSWQSVLDREYHEWRQDRIVIDTANGTPRVSLSELIAQLPGD